MIGQVSRRVRFRVAGTLVIVGLLVETWSLFQENAAGFMVFVILGLSCLGLGVALNVYWVSLDLSLGEGDPVADLAEGSAATTAQTLQGDPLD